MPSNGAGHGGKDARGGPANGGGLAGGTTFATAKFVAEVSSNHHSDLERCREFIRRAAAIGCEAVKFQLFRVRELFAAEALDYNPGLLNREAWELPVSFLPELSRCCHDEGIEFSCTPFYLQAVEELLPFVAFYKIASYELLWDDLLIACARTGKPVVLSTGMATLEEVQRACGVLREGGCRDLTLLHCVSSYPAPPEVCNLAAIETLREACNCPVGWSDHSVDAGVVLRAVHRWGATMVEFHIDLEGKGAEYASRHCWLPEQIEPVIAAAKAGFKADGSPEVRPAECELEERQWRADPADGLRPLQATRRLLQPNRT
jgi:sialic acid synthase SpsE